jgi:flavin reductase (DIM6/NTAB) family NADH-FMN oxidoreductase RutF
VTAAAGNRSGGLVATWVSPASIDPKQPTVLVGLAPNHFTAKLVRESGGFALHLLAEVQTELVWRFGIGSGRDSDKLAGLSYRKGESGSPILGDCLAWLDCRVIAMYDAGDRLFFWADAIDGGRSNQGKPLREREALARASADSRYSRACAFVPEVAASAP